MAHIKATIKYTDMPEELIQSAIDLTTQALEKFVVERDIAAYIKKEFDQKHGPVWHCIVGRCFGAQ